MSDQNVKQKIVDKLRDIDTVLVTVNTNPTVDELSAALGFTLLVNKLNKHATAVFSGEIPPAITFLDPEKTFENTVDSLRDFIIALDKEKADHLRYKVEGEMVKIFITPYRTTIDDRDLEFSQGDYNVEMVVALGVKNSDELDKALADHGRIMHDATVASISIGEDSSELGSLNWHENDASSYSELLVSLSEALRSDKNLIDEQIATAFLTGIVAATDRFSNNKTTSKAMTMAAQLMAAGANQQLIATKLEEADELSSPDPKKAAGEDGKPKQNNDGTTNLDDNVSTKVDRGKDEKPSEPEEPVKDKQAPDGTMTISHEKKGDLDEVARQTAQENQQAAAKEAEEALAKSLADAAPVAAVGSVPSVADLQQDLKKAAEEIDEDAEKPAGSSHEMTLPPPAETSPMPAQTPEPLPGSKDPDMPQFEPTFGGTLNATSEQAAADKRREEEADRNKTILSHDGSTYAAGAPDDYPAVNSFNKEQNEPPSVDPLSAAPTSGGVTSRGQDLQPLTPPTAPPHQTLEDLDRQNRAQPQDAQSAIDDALNNAPSMSQQQQQIPTLPSPTMQPQQPAGFPPAPTGDTGGLPPLPPMPDFSTLPPLPSSPGAPVPTTDNEVQLPTVSPVNAVPVTPQVAAPTDPGQFQIPTQQ